MSTFESSAKHRNMRLPGEPAIRSKRCFPSYATKSSFGRYGCEVCGTQGAIYPSGDGPECETSSEVLEPAKTSFTSDRLEKAICLSVISTKSQVSRSS